MGGLRLQADSRGGMLANAELREFPSGVGSETWGPVAGFRIGLEIRETSRDPEQDLWQQREVPQRMGPVEGGHSLFLVALPCPAE